jgi:hypothetical protein
MSAPVKAPSSAADYTPATLDPELRSQLNAVLIRDGHIAKIQDHILHSLHSHQSDWPTAVQNHVLALLRSGDVTSFPALLRRVLEDIRTDTLSQSNETSTTGRSSNGDKKGGANGAAASDANGAQAKGLALPQSVIDDAVKVTRESLNEVLDVVDG